MDVDEYVFVRQKLLPMIGSTCSGESSWRRLIAITRGGLKLGHGILVRTLLLVVFVPGTLSRISKALSTNNSTMMGNVKVRHVLWYLKEVWQTRWRRSPPCSREEKSLQVKANMWRSCSWPWCGHHGGSVGERGEGS